MKNLTQYVHKAELAFFNYIKREDLSELVTALKRIEDHAHICFDGESDDKGIWFKFFTSDTGAHTIEDIKRDLESNINREYMLDNFKIGCSIEGNIKVYYS